MTRTAFDGMALDAIEHGHFSDDMPLPTCEQCGRALARTAGPAAGEQGWSCVVCDVCPDCFDARIEARDRRDAINARYPDGVPVGDAKAMAELAELGAVLTRSCPRCSR